MGAPSAKNLLASNGMDIYADTDTHNAPAGGGWVALVALDDIVINAITDNGDNPSLIPTATTFRAGSYISAEGLFTSIDLTSGVVGMIRG